MQEIRDLGRWHLLVVELTRREFKGRYVSAHLGVAWAVLNPLFQTAVFTFVFSRVLRLPSEGFPYAVWALTALLVWNAFRSTVVTATNAIVDDRTVIKRVPFPRWLIPLSIVSANTINYLITVPILVAFVLVAGVRVPATTLLLLVPAISIAALALAVGLCTSALCVFYRDVKYLIEPVLLLWFYGSPIFYSTDAVPAHWRMAYQLNPLVGIIDLSRGVFLRGEVPLTPPVLIALAMTGALLAIGFAVYRRFAPRFVDML